MCSGSNRGLPDQVNPAQEVGSDEGGQRGLMGQGGSVKQGRHGMDQGKLGGGSAHPMQHPLWACSTCMVHLGLATAIIQMQFQNDAK